MVIAGFFFLGRQSTKVLWTQDTFEQMGATSLHLDPPPADPHCCHTPESYGKGRDATISRTPPQRAVDGAKTLPKRISICQRGNVPNRRRRSDAGGFIATIGQAKLVKKLDRESELIGGSERDRAEAQGWISMFMKNDTVN